jgi:subtilisin family serine protease
MDGDYTYTFDGSGVRIYVVDTGVRTSHDEFGTRTTSGADVYSGDSQNDATQDNDGHGTQTAGIAAASTYGVAKGATVVPIRFRDASGGLVDTQDFIAALNWIRDNHPSGTRGVMVAAATMPDDGTQDADDIDAAAQEVLNRGVVIAHSAGNNGLNSSRALNRMPDVLTVGMHDTNASVYTDSNHGPNVQVYAPTEVLTTDNASDTATFTTGVGTSSSAPHAAGVCALYLEANPHATVREVVDWVVDNATVGALDQVHPESFNRALHSRLWTKEPIRTEVAFSDPPYEDRRVTPGTRYRYRVRSTSPNTSDFTGYQEIAVSGSTTATGTVTIDGAAVENARVEVLSQDRRDVLDSVLTDANGDFSVEVPSGDHAIAWTFLDENGDFGTAGTTYGEGSANVTV